MARTHKVQLGCLLALLLFISLGFAVEYFGKPGPPGDDEGGGPIAAVGIIGLVLFFVIFAVVELVRALLPKRQDEDTGGFPIEPRRPDEK